MIHKADILKMDYKVCKALKINKDQLFWIKSAHGCEFLKVWIGDEFETDIKLMEQLPEFWAWWQQVWYNEDKRYLDTFKLQDQASYINHHAPDRIAFRPNSVIAESYHKLIKSLAKPELSESNF